MTVNHDATGSSPVTGAKKPHNQAVCGVFALCMAETESERELIEKLYKEKRQRMFAAARRYLKTDEDAEDAVHEAFLRITSEKTKIFEVSPDKINRYLDIIMRNICVDVIKEHVEKEEYISAAEDTVVWKC